MNEPKSLGRYEVRGVLGKGAMGLVYDGYDPKLDRRVAIKTILTRALDAPTAKRHSQRFEREVQAVARLNHPNIVQVYDYGSQADLAYIVMEYVQGRELKDYFEAKERFDLNTILRLMIELLGALECAHEAGVIHRDVKPANVMIDASAHVKLMDFGVARITDAEPGEMTRAGTLIGTVSYMSPEQIQGRPIDPRSDLFSAGIVFYQFLTGERPFDGTHWELAKKIIQDPPVWPSALVEIAPVFDRVVARALAKAPEQRYQSAARFAAALQRISEGKTPENLDETVPLIEGGEAETEFWNGVKESDDPEELMLYVEQFPHGLYVEQAQRRVAELRGKRLRGAKV